MGLLHSNRNSKTYPYLNLHFLLVWFWFVDTGFHYASLANLELIL